MKLLLFVAIFLVTPVVWAATLHVPGDYATIQSGIDAAGDGDTVLVANGIYLGDGNHDIDTQGKIITVKSENGAENCTIRCQGSEVSMHRAFIFQSLEDQGTIVDGFTISNGYQLDGGAVLITLSSPVIRNCIFSNNVAVNNGGAISSSGDPLITNCTFMGNTAANQGGAFNCTQGSPQITSCTFTENSADSGGAIYCDFLATPVIGGAEGAGNYFDDNFSPNGADLSSTQENSDINALYNTFSGMYFSDYYVAPQSSFNLANCTSEMTAITQDVYVSPTGDNTNDGLTETTPFKSIQFALSRVYGTETDPVVIHIADGTYSQLATNEKFPLPLVQSVSLYGESRDGTILNARNNSRILKGYYDANIGVRNLTFTGGSATIGGAASLTHSTATFLDCTFSSCTSVLDGGAIYLSLYANIDATNCVFSGNNSGGNGGAVFGRISSPEFNNCLFYDNTSDADGGASYFTSAAPYFTLCTFAQNTATGDGGAVCCELSNSLITMADSILFGNTATNGGEISLHTAADIAMEFCDVQGGQEGIDTSVGANVDWGNGMMDADPQFTTGSLGNFYLDTLSRIISPCIDAGSNTSEYYCFTTQNENICMNTLTTRTDNTPDSGTVDLGYHYPVPEPDCLHTGDANLSGGVSSGDAQFTFQIALGLVTPTYTENCAADCDNSGTVTSGDAQSIFRLALGMDSCVDPL